MKYLCIALLLLSVSKIAAKSETDTTYAVSMIAPALKENAHIVIRNDNTEVNIISPSKARYKTTYAITILDAKGDGYASLDAEYNLLQKIDDLSGNLYDEHGKLIKKMSKNDALDISTFGSGVFHSDARRKKYNFDYYKYPFTVEYTEEYILNTTFFLPNWSVQPRTNVSVENSGYTLTYPDNVPARFKEYLMPASLVRTQTKDKDLNILGWNLKNIPARYEQPFSQSDNFEGPTLVLSPDKFSLLGHDGDMNSWKDLGAFIYQLNNGLDVLPDDKKATVKSLTGGLTTTYDKVQKLYSYMQESTRYVAIEYGINGWQTFDAMNVAQTGYGDCKGLTNYLKALLKEAGIKSYATLVFAGRDSYYKLDESFPSNVFNHVILCVPDDKDTIWVECTNQHLLAGYLGDFTQDRKVLLITENGGVVTHTPSYDINKTFIDRKATIDFNPDTTAQKIKLNNRYGALMQDDLSYLVKNEPENKMKEIVSTKFPFSSYTVNNFKYHQTGNRSLPELEEQVEVSVSGITTKTQKRTFLNIGWMNNPMTSISQLQPRTAPLVLEESFKITDTVIINIPEGIELESMPDPVDLSFDFGMYHTKFEHNKNQIIFTRKYIQNKGTFKVEDYNNYLKMYTTVSAGKNNLNLVFLNKAS